ncbi:ABC transporter substrate-binding protein, partial [Xanthomonas citri pv. citri]|nr:ABC transporter substrate-binding protein [Xanthomonas citri pv. citri]
VSSNDTGRMAKYLNGECDVVALPEPSQRTIVPHNEIIESPGANLAFLAFNMQKPAMKEIALRRRIAGAINHKRIADTLFYGAANVANNVL